MIHCVVETLDKWFSNVCELDIMFSLDTTHHIIDEMVANGTWQRGRGRGGGGGQGARGGGVKGVKGTCGLFMRAGQYCALL